LAEQFTIELSVMLITALENPSKVSTSVSGERRGTELVAESRLNGVELWQKRL
jgi:hypothetical protein